MASHGATADRWAQVVGTPNPRYLRGSRVFVADDRLYSYGRHFELARLVGDRRRGFVLLNGDRFSVSTSGHQADARGAVASAGLPYAIIPYSALDAAGVEKDSIRVLETLPDRHIETRHTVDVPGLVELGARAASGASGWSDSEASRGGGGALAAHGEMRHDGAEYSVAACKRGRAYNGASGVAEWRDYDPPEVTFYRNHGSLKHVGGDTFEYSTYRHFLGACLFTAETRGSKARVKFLSAFDENERRPLYFLCQLPRCSARTYTEALDALAPRIVHAAIAQGREVKRQGDIFSIPTSLTRADLRAQGARFGKRVPLLETNHATSEVAFVKGAVYGRGCMYHDVPRARDHARIRLGDGWHLIVRNTVPRVRRVSAGRPA